MMDIAVVGTGYVGLVSGVCFAERGHRVICVDTDQEKVAQINAAKVPFMRKALLHCCNEISAPG